MKATKPSRKTAESAKKTKVTKKPKSAKPAKGTAAEHASGNTDPADAALLKRGEEAWHACSPALRVAAGMATPTSAGLTLWGADGVPDAAAAWLRALAVPAATKVQHRQPLEDMLGQFGLSFKTRKARREALTKLTEKAVAMTAAYTTETESEFSRAKAVIRDEKLLGAWSTMHFRLSILEDALRYLASSQRSSKNGVLFGHGAAGIWLTISGEVRLLRVVIDRIRETLDEADALQEGTLPITQRWKTKASLLLQRIEEVFGPAADVPLPPGEPAAPGRRWAMRPAEEAAKHATQFVPESTQLKVAFAAHSPRLTAAQRAEAERREAKQYKPLRWFNKCIEHLRPKRKLYSSQFARGVALKIIKCRSMQPKGDKLYEVLSVCMFPPFAVYASLFENGLRNNIEARGKPRGRSVRKPEVDSR